MRPHREPRRSNAYIYFVSTQTVGRKPFFRHERWARLMMATLDHYSGADYVLHAYVIMPDHLHVLITPSTSVEKSVQLIKGGFSFRAKREIDWKGEIWQQGFTDHRIRSEEDWEHHIAYIRQNPIQAGLGESAVLYPYMNILSPQFPRGLKPHASEDVDVRAEARTLHAEGRTLRAEAGPLQADVRTFRAEASTIQTETRTPQAEGRPLQAEASTIQTEARTRQAEARTLQVHGTERH